MATCVASIMGLVSLRKLSSSFTVKSAWTLTSDIMCIWI